MNDGSGAMFNVMSSIERYDKEELARLKAENERLREALEEFGSSRIRDRVAARVGCNHDLLHDALQAEVRKALERTNG